MQIDDRSLVQMYEHLKQRAKDCNFELIVSGDYFGLRNLGSEYASNNILARFETVREAHCYLNGWSDHSMYTNLSAHLKKVK